MRRSLELFTLALAVSIVGTASLMRSLSITYFACKGRR